MDSVYIGGVGMTRFGQSERGLLDLLSEAGRAALADGGEPAEALFIGAMSPEALGHISNLATTAAHALGLSGRPAIRVETASSSGAAVLAVAASSIASGQYRRVLAIAGEKMTGLPTAHITRVLAEVIDEEERSVGLTMPAMAAIIARAYAHAEHIGEGHLKEVLAQIAIKAHDNGALNPRAHFQKAITLKDYRKSRSVSDPLSLYDCAPISDGAAAVVLTSRETDIRIAGLGQGTDTPSLCDRQTLTGFPATTHAARKAYGMAGFGPSDIDFAEIHDAFTIFELTSMGDLGLFECKEALEAIEEGQTGLQGRLPVNPSGGLKSRGHPVGASGLAQIVEAALQMRGQAEPLRQLSRTSRALTHSIGGPGSNNFVVLLERADSDRAVVPVLDIPEPEEDVGASTEEEVPSEAGAAAGLEFYKVQSFTTLHTPAEGFPAPLTLAVAGRSDNGRVLARVPWPQGLRIEARATLSTESGLPELTILPPRRLSLRWMLAGASKARRLWGGRRPPTMAGR